MVSNNRSRFARCRHSDSFCTPSISSLVPSLIPIYQNLPRAGGLTWVSKTRGCAIQIVKVPPINPEKFLKSIPIYLENFLKIIPINPEMPKQLTNLCILTESYTHKSGKCKKLLKTIPINLESIMKKVP